MFILYPFRSWVLTIIAITMAQCFEFPGNKNVTDSIHKTDHNTNALPPTFHMNYSSMELVLLEKLPDNEVSRSIFRVTIFFQFSSTKSSLNILLQYVQGLEENIQTLYTRLVTNNNNQEAYKAPQRNLAYASLLTSCSQEVNNYKCQIIKLYI